MQPATLYDQLGGEQGVRRLVAAFYRHMRERPDAAAILAMHPDLDRAEQRLFEFLSGWTGGPQLYWERHGHPQLRRRHLPFPIDAAARDAWMACMTAAADEAIPSAQLRADLLGAFTRIAAHMQNR